MGPFRNLTVTPVQPHSARKTYICPGCDNTIPPGTFHLVVVPEDQPDLRRHWHHGCWHKEQRRLRGRRSALGHATSPSMRREPPRER